MASELHREVVRILDDAWLINAESYQCRCRAGPAIPPGYYVVEWPGQLPRLAYDEHARFVGPFRTRAEAAGAQR